MSKIILILLTCFACNRCSPIDDSLGSGELIPLSQEPFEVPEANATDEVIGRNQRIVFGSNAAAGQFPHYALIFVNRPTASVQCGAGLIAEQWALTADHCVRDAISIELRFGLTTRDRYEQKMFAAALARQTPADMALIKMTAKVRVTSLVKPALLPRSSERNKLYVNSMATLCGMGLENQKTYTVSTYLKYAELEVMAQADCNKYYGTVDPRMLCAKSPVSYASSCPGDSGSPLIVKDNGSPVIIGTVSFGAASGCDLGYPVGYSRTTHQLDWIVSYTGQTLRT